MADKDRRTYVTVHDGLPDHPKIIEAGGEAAWLYLCGVCFCSRQLTDGMIPKRVVRRLTDLSNPEALASALLRVGLWHETGHDCPRCPPVDADHYVVHDYTVHQKSAEEVRDLKAKRSAAGRKGGKRSGQARKGGLNGEANREAFASDLLNQTGSKTQPPTPTPTPKERSTTYSSTSETAQPPSDDDQAHDPPVRHDVERACRTLADLIEANGSRKPTITKAWRDAARLMIDKDGIALDDVLGAIRWSQADEFWRGNILSMPTLRKQYDRLRLAAARQRPAGHALAPTGTEPGRPMSTTDRKVADAMALADRLLAEEQQQ